MSPQRPPSAERAADEGTPTPDPGSPVPFVALPSDAARPDDGEDPSPCDPQGDPAAGADLFTLLAHEMRLRILFELVRNRTDGGFLEGMSYTELRNAADAATDDGFSYHLSKLDGPLVRKYDHGGRSLYVPTTTGYAVYRALVGGVLAGPGDPRAVPIDASCVACDRGLVVDLYPGGESLARVDCPDCEFAHTLGLSDPAVGDDAVEETLRRADDRERARTELCRRGTCPYCAGDVRRRVHPTDEVDVDLAGSLSYVVVGLCERCDETLVSSVGSLVRGHPRVVAFFRERGRDVRSVPTWELAFAATDEYTTPVRTDPPKLRVEIPCAGDVLSMTVDAEATVLDVAGSGE